MRSNYKKLGEYIRPVDERNSDLAITNLQGVSITKEFVPSIANIIGTDLSTYKIVRTGQFAYGPVTSRNGDKVSIALLKGEDCIISSSYSPFEVYKPDELLPEYLMLWFMRPEFDRYARFMSNGSAREVFDWDCMCGVELPVPPLPEQQKIVREYKVITDRIRLLREINSNLEETALTIYKGWFVDFLPFGEQKPDDWQTLTLGDVAIMGAGGDRPEVCIDAKTADCSVPIYSNGIENDGLYGFTDTPKITKESVTVSARGTIGFVCLRTTPYVPIVRLVTLIPKEHITTAKYLFLYLKNMNILGTGSTQQQLTVPDFQKTEIIMPPYTVINDFSRTISPLFNQKIENEREIECLLKLSSTVLCGVAL